MFTLALALQLTTLAFHQLTTHVDLFPFNNVRHFSRRERLIEGGVNGIAMAVPVALLLTDRTWTVLVSASLFSLLFAMELLMWWLPYATGLAVPALVQGDEPWPAMHARVFAPTLTVVPSIADHPRPNLEHTLLHSLTLAAAVSTWAYLLGR